MLNAPNTPRWRAWLLLAAACWAAVAPAFATAFASGFSFRRPETRVWNFFPPSVESRQEIGAQVADSHQGNEGYGYEIASGVHVYLYANVDPVGGCDPSGHLFVANFIYGNFVHDAIGADFEERGFGVSDARLDSLLGVPNIFGAYRPDLTTPATQKTPGEVYEIKTVITGQTAAVVQLGFYLAILNSNIDPQKRIWLPGTSYNPPAVIPIKPGTVAFVRRTAPGVILYEVIDATEIMATAAIYGIANIEIDLSFALTLSLRGIN